MSQQTIDKMRSYLDQEKTTNELAKAMERAALGQKDVYGPLSKAVASASYYPKNAAFIESMKNGGPVSLLRFLHNIRMIEEQKGLPPKGPTLSYMRIIDPIKWEDPGNLEEKNDSSSEITNRHHWYGNLGLSKGPNRPVDPFDMSDDAFKYTYGRRGQ